MTRCDPTSADLLRGAHTLVVVAVADNDGPDDALLTTAVSEAQRRAHSLRIVHLSRAAVSRTVTDAPPREAPPGSVQRSDGAGMHYWSDAVLHRHPYLMVDAVTIHADPADPAEALAAAAHDAALLVVGYRSTGRPRTDSTLNDIVDAAPCPVLVVPAGSADVRRGR